MDGFICESMRVHSKVHIKQILQLNISARVNEHASMIIKGIIDDHISVDSLCGEEISLSYYNEKNIMLFNGYIQTYKINRDSGYRMIEINSISISGKIDEYKHSKSFQNVNQKYSELLAEVIGLNGKILVDRKYDQKTGQFLLQYNETDWEFIKRVANRMKAFIIPDIKNTGIKLLMGENRGLTKRISQWVDYTATYDIEGYRVKKAAWSIDELKNYWIQSYDDYDLGDEVLFQEELWTILEKNVLLINGLYSLKYRLCKKGRYIHDEYHNKNIQGLHLFGRVLKTEHETIKVKLDIDESQSVTTAHEFLYCPVTGNIMYSMPEPGARVTLYFPDYNENSALIINSFLDNNTFNKSLRGIEILKKKRLILGSGAIRISSQKSQIALSDDNGVLLDSIGNIKINSCERLSVRCAGICAIEGVKGINVSNKNGKEAITINGMEMVLESAEYITSGLPFKGISERVPKEQIVDNQKKITDELANRVHSGIPIGAGNDIERLVLGMLPRYKNPAKSAGAEIDRVMIKY